MTDQSNNRPQDASMRLILDLIGPFVVHFCEGIARIHAPLCADHHANILTDSNDIPLYGLLAPSPPDGYPKGFIYGLTGPTGNTNKPDCLNPNFCMTPDNLLVLTKSIDPIDPRGCHLVLYAPRPDNMVPLIPERIWIHKNKAEIWVNPAAGEDPDIVTEDRARGLRFIYSACPSAPKIRLLEHPEVPYEEVKSDLKHLDAYALGFDPSQYHITLRFTSNSTAPDEHHEDAYNCFQEMRTLIPKAGVWRVDFDDSPNSVPVKKGPFYPMHHGGSHPTDCGAAVLVVPDL